jgi:hypothetical protein
MTPAGRLALTVCGREARRGASSVCCRLATVSGKGRYLVSKKSARRFQNLSLPPEGTKDIFASVLSMREAPRAGKRNVTSGRIGV